MIYNHKRLKEVKKLTFYPEGKMMLVWDIEKPEYVMERKVFAVLCDPIPPDIPYPVCGLNADGSSNFWAHCAEIPKENK
jgi:hypothetical protein